MGKTRKVKNRKPSRNVFPKQRNLNPQKCVQTSWKLQSRKEWLICKKVGLINDKNLGGIRVERLEGLPVFEQRTGLPPTLQAYPRGKLETLESRRGKLSLSFQTSSSLPCCSSPT